MSRRTVLAVALVSLLLIVVGAVLTAALDGSKAGTAFWALGCAGVVVAAVGGAFRRARQNR